MVFISLYRIFRRSGLGLRIHEHTAPVIKLSFVPISPVGQVGLPGGRAIGNVGLLGFVMCPSLVAARFGLLPFRVCHVGTFFLVQAGPSLPRPLSFSHLGSIPGMLFSSLSVDISLSRSMVCPSHSRSGWTRRRGTARLMNS